MLVWAWCLSCAIAWKPVPISDFVVPCEQVHDDPTTSPVDGPTQWPLRHLEELLVELIAIAKITKGKQNFQIDLSPYDPDTE